MTKESIKLSELYNFFEKQKIATKTADEYKYTLYGGSAGPGKSYWLRWYPIRKLIKWHHKTGLEGIRTALFCEDYPALKDRHVSKMQYEFPSWLGSLKETKTDGLAFVLNKSFGSGVLALRNLDDPSKYLSSEFALIAIDELTMNDKKVFDMLRMRCRWTGLDDTKMIMATNPGQKGHAWVKKMWIDREFEIEEQEADQFAYIKALPSDNPYLAESYKIALQSLPEKLKKAYWEGNWDVFEGQYFSEWDCNKHVIDPFALPDTFKRIRCIDHGRTNPTACLWGAIDYDGKIYWYREYYRAGVDADINAQEIARLSAGERYGFTVMDSACYAKTGTGETIAEIYQRNGVMAEPAPKNRIAGWALFHEYLRETKMQFFKNCVNAIRTIPLAIHDDKRPEDIDTDGEDHALDAMSYALQYLHESKSPKKLDPVEEMLMKLKRRDTINPINLNTFYGNK